MERFVREEAETARANRDWGASSPEPGRPPTIAELLRGPFQILVDELYEGLAEAGYPVVRPAHGNVFGYVRE